MCGIAGFFGGGEMEDIRAMTSRLDHRGPDAEGFYTESGLFLGHRRLSILDIAGGSQPMVSADGRTVIVFNGEIYNHADLRAELIGCGRVFTSHHSDTEVLLQGWQEWGEGLLSRLSGMWAFAIWDAVTRRLFLSRDRFGKKPIYYFQRQGTFAFASELTALLAHPHAPRNLSEIARVKFLAHGFFPTPHSAIAGIWKLPAAHNLTITDPASETNPARYWRYEIEPRSDVQSEEALCEEFVSVLRRAVERRLIADVPVGIFLSGGIDSSAIAALAAQVMGGGALRTFTIGFSEASFDESAPARRMADFLGTQHSVEKLDIEAALNALPEIFDRLDEPQGDASLLPTWLLCRFARREVKVALSGDGGDELFAGYDPFRALGMASFYAKIVPRPLHKAIRMLAARLPVSHANMSLDFKLKRTLRGLDHPPSLWNPVWLGALEPGEVARVTGSDFSVEQIYSEAIASWDASKSPAIVDRTLQFYTECYLQDAILPKADRASMMNSLEVRSPFLDLEVANFARTIPHSLKLRGGDTKYLLKRAMAGVLPDDILHRKKKGFGMPIGSWLQSGRITPAGISPFLQKKLKSHVSGAADERLYLWCEYVWQQWLSRRKGVI